MGEMLTLTTEDGHRRSACKATPASTPRAALVVVRKIVTDSFAAAGHHKAGHVEASQRMIAIFREHIG